MSNIIVVDHAMPMTQVIQTLNRGLGHHHLHHHSHHQPQLLGHLQHHQVVDHHLVGHMHEMQPHSMDETPPPPPPPPPPPHAEQYHQLSDHHHVHHTSDYAGVDLQFGMDAATAPSSHITFLDFNAAGATTANAYDTSTHVANSANSFINTNSNKILFFCCCQF